SAGDKRVALRAHLLLFNDLWEEGDPTRAETHVRAYAALAAEFPQGTFEWVAVGIRAATALWEGRFDDAEALYREADVLARRDGARGTSMAALPAIVCCATERYVDLAGIESRVRAAFGSMTHDLGACLGEILVARVHGRAGDVPRARRQLDVVRALPVFAAIEEA